MGAVVVNSAKRIGLQAEHDYALCGAKMLTCGLSGESHENGQFDNCGADFIAAPSGCQCNSGVGSFREDARVLGTRYLLKPRLVHRMQMALASITAMTRLESVKDNNLVALPGPRDG